MQTSEVADGAGWQKSGPVPLVSSPGVHATGMATRSNTHKVRPATRLENGVLGPVLSVADVALLFGES